MGRLRRCSRWYCLRDHRDQLAAITDLSHQAIKSTLKRSVIVRLSIPELVPVPQYIAVQQRCGSSETQRASRTTSWCP
eukprot:COSAG02_NODE_3014_length_7551_cov_83.019995_1_plen_78_part_00